MRSNGRDVLKSKRPLVEILGRCSRNRLGLFEGKEIWILKFSDDVENSLKLKLSKLRVKGADMDPSEISGALLQNFPIDKRYGYILSDAALGCLRDLDMQIDEEVFGSARYLLNLAKELYPQIVRTHFNGCMRLMEILVSDEDPPIQGIIDSGVIPDVIKGMTRVFETEYAASCIHILSKLFQGKNEDQVKTILESDFLDYLYDYFYSTNMPSGAIEDSCKSLEYIISTSVSLRDTVLKSGVLENLLSYMNHGSIIDCQPCIELWQTICSSYKDSSPIDISLMNIRVRWMAPLLTRGIDQLIEFVESALSFEVENPQSPGAIHIASFSSYAVPIRDLLLSSKSHIGTLGLPVKVFCLLSELDFFGSIANEFGSASIDSMFGIFTKLLELTPKSTEDENLVKQACKSIGYLVRFWYCKPDLNIRGHKRPRGWLISSMDKYRLPWVKTLMKLTYDGNYLTVLHHHLLLRISKSIDKGVPIKQCNLSFFEIISMLKIGSSLQDVEDELVSLLHKRTQVTIEEQLGKFIEYCNEEEDYVSQFIVCVQMYGIFSYILHLAFVA